MNIFRGIFVVLLFVASVFSDSSRILNGYPLEIEQAPYIVHIQFITKVENGRTHYGLCGGSIINEKYILTAGHCEILSFLYFYSYFFLFLQVSQVEFLARLKWEMQVFTRFELDRPTRIEVVKNIKRRIFTFEMGSIAVEQPIMTLE